MSRPKARKFRKTRKPTDHRPPERDFGEIVHGTVGYNDGSDHFEVDDEGVPLLKVTLFQGVNPDQQGPSPDPTRARGLPVLARFDGRSSDIPPDGELVILARPAGMRGAPAAYYLIGRPMPNPKWIPNQVSGEKIIFGPKDSFIRFKADGTIFLFCKDGDGDDARPIYVKVHREGVEMRHPHGKLRLDKQGFGMDHSSGASISGGSIGGLPAPLDALSSLVTIRAAALRMNATAVSIGPDGCSPDNLMLATPTLGILSAIVGSIDALQAAIIAVEAVAAAATPTGASAAAISAAGLALTALATAVLNSDSAMVAGTVNAPTHACLSG